MHGTRIGSSPAHASPEEPEEAESASRESAEVPVGAASALVATDAFRHRASTHGLGEPCGSVLSMSCFLLQLSHMASVTKRLNKESVN